MGSEIKVGVVFFLGVAILFVMTVIVTGFTLFEEGYAFPVYFNNIGGIEEGARVLYLGVNVGTVEDVAVKEGMVRLLIRVEDKDIFIPEDSDVTIEQSNLLAGMQVSITAGKSNQPIQEAELKRGINPAPFTQALSDAAVAAEKAIEGIREPLTKTIENIEDITREIKEGPGTAHDLIYESEIYENIRTASEKLSNVLAELDEGKGTLGKLIKDDELYENVRDITRDVKDVTARVKSGFEGEGILAKLFSDESSELYADLKDTAAGAKQLLNRLNAGEGTLGKLFTSDELYEDVKSITGSLRSTTRKIDETLHSKNSTIGKLFNESTLYDKAVKTIDDLDQTLGAAARMRVFVYLGFFTSNHPFQESRGVVHLKVWPHDKRYFLLGATFTDVGKASPLIYVDPEYERKGRYLANPDFQLAWVFNLGSTEDKKDKEPEGNKDKDEDQYNLTLRVGLLDSLVGGGFDFDFWRNFRITCEVRTRHRSKSSFYEDISPYYARAYLSMKVLKYFRIYAGADNLAHKAVMSFGISIEWEDKDIKSIIGIAGSAY